jgi:hypothetical protein
MEMEQHRTIYMAYEMCNLQGHLERGVTELAGLCFGSGHPSYTYLSVWLIWLHILCVLLVDTYLPNC